MASRKDSAAKRPVAYMLRAKKMPRAQELHFTKKSAASAAVLFNCETTITPLYAGKPAPSGVKPRPHPKVWVRKPIL